LTISTFSCDIARAVSRRLRDRRERLVPTAPRLRGLRLALGTDTLAGCPPLRYALAWKRAWKRQTATDRSRRSRRALAKWSICRSCVRRRSRPQQRLALHTREVAGSKPAAPMLGFAVLEPATPLACGSLGSKPAAPMLGFAVLGWVKLGDRQAMYRARRGERPACTRVLTDPGLCVTTSDAQALPALSASTRTGVQTGCGCAGIG
jgi:hypothetical protein